MRHLLCGDPASNTLSWRWVAGLHTRGKTYLARRDNIRRYTDGRLDPGDRLRSTAPSLTGVAYPKMEPRVVPLAPRVEGRALLLLHDDDVGVDTLPLATYEIGATAGLLATSGRSPGAISERAACFAHDALADALGRMPHGDREAIFVADTPETTAATLSQLARNAGATVVLTPFAPVGPVRAALDGLRAPLEAGGVSLVEIGRRYDALAWPHATRGYFGLRERIPQILDELQTLASS